MRALGGRWGGRGRQAEHALQRQGVVELVGSLALAPVEPDGADAEHHQRQRDREPAPCADAGSKLRVYLLTCVQGASHRHTYPAISRIV